MVCVNVIWIEFVTNVFLTEKKLWYNFLSDESVMNGEFSNWINEISRNIRSEFIMNVGWLNQIANFFLGQVNS